MDFAAIIPGKALKTEKIEHQEKNKQGERQRKEF